ncbi:MAG: ribose-phosphate pyrophosphokinase [Armatimonadota bacterium]|nr:ribose-phosphate pyrophosphokinase [Armatimonadota bacterium]MDR7401500.1 ribose-phosphate pyrophosphokinase [Armatimonadota bacterium]MDR7437539.1 ribose-phosphate pyrophosphokinase [Armatimonadota bacterium]MDR7471692.1 ribose-phosphate pyrophosphokinase [Armatimonadota bacterium]MDR7507737.1 ribose-phosphate pyrophosphokinase [Armatimonadota bacterium]
MSQQILSAEAASAASRAGGRRPLKLFAGGGNPALAREIAALLDVPLAEMTVFRFADGEVGVRIDESVRGEDAFVIQPTGPPVNENLMELLVIVDALRRASADRITAVIPYFGYARQDRKTRPREPISAKLVANLLVAAGCHRILTVDLHAGQIWGFFDIPLDHLPARPILADYIARKQLANPVIVSPDVGGVPRAREFARRLGAPLAIIDKRRDRPNQVTDVVHVIGKVHRRTAILVDDIVDTAGTLVMGARALVRRGVSAVYACATHALLSGPAVDRLAHSPIQELVVTNTIPVPADRRPGTLTVLSVASLLAEAIRRIHEDRSVSQLFD